MNRIRMRLDANKIGRDRVAMTAAWTNYSTPKRIFPIQDGKCTTLGRRKNEMYCSKIISGRGEFFWFDMNALQQCEMSLIKTNKQTCLLYSGQTRDLKEGIFQTNVWVKRIYHLFAFFRANAYFKRRNHSLTLFRENSCLSRRNYLLIFIFLCLIMDKRVRTNMLKTPYTGKCAF